MVKVPIYPIYEAPVGTRLRNQALAFKFAFRLAVYAALAMGRHCASEALEVK